MTSALSPRDIQSRIRSGASLEDVAREAEVPAEKIEPFAAPVLAEREHVAGTALQCPVRRRGETGSVRAMSAVVEEKLGAQGIDPESVDWDAWRNEDRRWSVQARYQAGDEQKTALFTFDQRARFSVAANDDARWMIGEFTPAPAKPAAAAQVPDPEAADAEPTIDLNDELAIVRAVQGSVPLVEGTRPAPSPLVQQRDVQQRDVQHRDVQHRDVQQRDVQPREASQPDTAEVTSPQQAAPSVPTAPEVTVQRVVEVEQVTVSAPAQNVEDDEREVDDYSPAELEEVDGIYDIVPNNTSDMDVLYEMLSSFSEDSVNIYAGLTSPVTQDAQPAGAAEVAEAADEPVEPLHSAEHYHPEVASAAEVDPEDDPQVAELSWVDAQESDAQGSDERSTGAPQTPRETQDEEPPSLAALAPEQDSLPETDHAGEPDRGAEAHEVEDAEGPQAQVQPEEPVARPTLVAVPANDADAASQRSAEPTVDPSAPSDAGLVQADRDQSGTTSSQADRADAPSAVEPDDTADDLTPATPTPAMSDAGRRQGTATAPQAAPTPQSNIAEEADEPEAEPQLAAIEDVEPATQLPVRESISDEVPAQQTPIQYGSVRLDTHQDQPAPSESAQSKSAQNESVHTDSLPERRVPEDVARHEPVPAGLEPTEQASHHDEQGQVPAGRESRPTQSAGPLEGAAAQPAVTSVSPTISPVQPGAAPGAGTSSPHTNDSVQQATAPQQAPAVAQHKDPVSEPSQAGQGQASQQPESQDEPAVEIVDTDHVQLVEEPAVVIEELTEPEQDALVAAPENTPVAPKPKPSPRKKKRASVPSWDEIMFGGPAPKGK